MTEHTDRIKVFTDIYERNVWGQNSSNNNSYKGTSGDGSTISYNINTYIPFIKKFLKKKDIKTVVDLGCGDWQSSHLIYNDINITYYGYDAYEKVCINNNKNFPQYTFTHLDFVKDKNLLKNADLCIIKDVLQHLCNKDIVDLLQYIITNKKYKYIIITNCCRQMFDNQDVVNGDFRKLTANLNPLKQFNPKIIGNYGTKEISLIDTSIVYNQNFIFNPLNSNYKFRLN